MPSWYSGARACQQRIPLVNTVSRISLTSTLKKFKCIDRHNRQGSNIVSAVDPPWKDARTRHQRVANTVKNQRTSIRSHPWTGYKIFIYRAFSMSRCNTVSGAPLSSIKSGQTICLKFLIRNLALACLGSPRDSLPFQATQNEGIRHYPNQLCIPLPLDFIKLPLLGRTPRLPVPTKFSVSSKGPLHPERSRYAAVRFHSMASFPE